MVKDETKKEKEMENEKDGRPNCPLCGQHYDVDKRPTLPEKMPIPAGQAKLIVNEQLKADEAIAAIEKINLERLKAVNSMAKAHKMPYRVNLNVEDDPREPEHQDEFYFRDPLDVEDKIWLHVKITKEERNQLDEMNWKAAQAYEDADEANNSYKEVLRGIAGTMGWYARPLVMSQGNFIAPNVIEEAVKRAKEEEQKKHEGKTKA
jgi:hypothetical protein